MFRKYVKYVKAKKLNLKRKDSEQKRQNEREDVDGLINYFKTNITDEYFVIKMLRKEDVVRMLSPKDNLICIEEQNNKKIGLSKGIYMGITIGTTLDFTVCLIHKKTVSRECLLSLARTLKRDETLGIWLIKYFEERKNNKCLYKLINDELNLVEVSIANLYKCVIENMIGTGCDLNFEIRLDLLLSNEERYVKSGYFASKEFYYEYMLDTGSCKIKDIEEKISKKSEDLFLKIQIRDTSVNIHGDKETVDTILDIKNREIESCKNDIKLLSDDRSSLLRQMKNIKAIYNK